MSESSIVVAVLVVYLAILFGIAIWSRAATRSLEGYYLGGRRLPYWVAGFSANATGESSWLLLGLSGMGYLVGVHAFWIVVGETIGVWLGWRLVAARLKTAADRHASITVTDLLADALPGPSRPLRIAAIVIILSMVSAYVSAQMVATGKIFSSFLPMTYAGGVVLGGIITLAYTAYGGFKAVAYSDVLQGVLMLSALIMIPAAGIVAIQGDFWATLAEQAPSLLDPSGGLGYGVAGGVALFSFLTIGFAFMAVPQILTRYMAIKDVREIRPAARIAIVCIVIFDTGAVLTGMAGRILFPEIADAETVLPAMARSLFPPVITGLVLVMVLAAVMSTVDSLLILASSAVVRDLLQKVVKPGWQEERYARIGKAVTVAIGVGAMLFALTEAKVIFWFVVFTQSGLAVAFGPPVLCLLFYRKTTALGALAGMAGAFVTLVVYTQYLKDYAYGLLEYVPGAIVGFALVILVSRATHKRETDESHLRPG